ncbi:MAG: hypothetical protein ACRDZ2_05125, partial [Ilumatobacteraceae bacterium]
LGLELLVRGGVAPDTVVGPRRPMADPGAPIMLRGPLDRIVATGLGLDLDALEESARAVGMAHALAATTPIVADLDGLEGAATTALHGALDTELARIAATAQPRRVGPTGRRGSAAAEVPDALDALIDGADAEAFDVRADGEERAT